MSWIDVGYITPDSGSFMYLFSYGVFATHASEEEKAELAHLRRQNGDNFQALCQMYARLMERQTRRQIQDEELSWRRQRQLDNVDNIPHGREIRGEQLRWHERGLSEEDIKKRTTYVSNDKITPTDLYIMFSEPVLDTIVINEHISIDIHDKMFGCYTYVFNEPTREGMLRRYRRVQYKEEFMALNENYILNLIDEVKIYLKKREEVQKRIKEHEDLQKRIAPILEEQRKWKQEYDAAKAYRDFLYRSEKSSKGCSIRSSRSSSSSRSSRSTSKDSSQRTIDHIKEALGMNNDKQKNSINQNLFDEQIF